MAAQLEDEKAQLRKRMRELEDELGGLRRVVRGRPTPLPAVGAIVEAEVTGHGEVVAFALLETFGTGFVHISEISRRIVITQPRGAAGKLRNGFHQSRLLHVPAVLHQGDRLAKRRPLDT